MLKRLDIRVRDPYILLHENVYYLYATSGEKTLSYYTSFDLENWEPGGIAFEIPADSWALKDVWAAEVHAYQEKFYLFVSLLGKHGLRGTQIAVADHPGGPFLPLENRPVTPLNQSCIDGTLFVSHGTPYIIYSHDWPDRYIVEKDAYVGRICAAQLSTDLHTIVGEPVVLFDSDQAPISRATPDHRMWEGHAVIRYGSDAPFIQSLSGGRLLLTWSPYLNGNYVVLGAICDSGSIFGPWKHLEHPVFQSNGGHAMFFHDNEERLLMCLHAPESPMLERAHLFQMEEQNGLLTVMREI